MPDKRIDQLSAAPSINATDLFEKCRDPGGVRAHEKVTLQELVDFVNLYLLLSVFDTTDDLRAATVLSGTKLYVVWGDETVDDGITRFYRYLSTDSQDENGLIVVIPDSITRPDTGSFIKIFP